MDKLIVTGGMPLKGEVRIRAYTGRPRDVAAYGPVSDEAGKRVFALTVAALCAIALATGPVPAWGIVVLMGIMGFAAGFSGPSRDMLVRRAATSTFGQSAFGRVYGFVYSGIDVGLACAPVFFGPLMDAGRYSHVLWGVAVLQTLAIATALTVGSKAKP